jgi:hypothetical protein
MLIRAFDDRQRRHAAGVWFRVRRVLADAREAHAISTDDANRLIAEGYRPEPVGQELSPPRVILLLPPERVARVPSARLLPVRLNGELLSAECLALVPFEEQSDELACLAGRRSRTDAGASRGGDRTAASHRARLLGSAAFRGRPDQAPALT